MKVIHGSFNGLIAAKPTATPLTVKLLEDGFLSFNGLIAAKPTATFRWSVNPVSIRGFNGLIAAKPTATWLLHRAVGRVVVSTA